MRGAWDMVGIRLGFVVAVGAVALVPDSWMAMAQISGASQTAPEIKPQVAPGVPAVALDPMRTDWPNLKRFHSDDVALPGPTAGEHRVVDMIDTKALVVEDNYGARVALTALLERVRVTVIAAESGGSPARTKRVRRR